MLVFGRASARAPPTVDLGRVTTPLRLQTRGSHWRMRPTYIGTTTFRHERRRFGILLPDRRQHLYCVGKTGTGKSTLLRNLIVQDIEAGHGVGLIDPHGDLARDLLDYIPAARTRHTVYLDPADADHPWGSTSLRPTQGIEGISWHRVW